MYKNKTKKQPRKRQAFYHTSLIKLQDYLRLSWSQCQAYLRKPVKWNKLYNGSYLGF